MKYRPDIDGLRALAVSSVVIFHADFQGFAAGGFFGVDVFFVISGFLITSLIVEETEAGKFSLMAFYERRIRRIIPAAAVVLMASAVFAWFTLLPELFVSFCKSLIAAAFFSSNWYFLNDVSYFAPPAGSKPLLHTWTLSIEEQFYLVYPFIMLTLNTGMRRFLVLGILCAGSIAYARSVGAGSFDGLFYNSFCRAFEPLIGCLTALVYRQLVMGPIASALLRVAGLALIGYAVFRLGVTDYRHLLVPCAGAAALLLARPNDRDPVYAVIASPPFRTLGKMSYSVYLWHWPVFVFARIYVSELTTAETVGCILLTLALSAVTLYTIENPVRFKRAVRGRAGLFAMAGASTTATVLFAATVLYNNGAPGRLPSHVQVIYEASRSDIDLYGCFDPPGGGGTPALLELAKKDGLCRIGDLRRANVDFVLWGDSHAFAMSKTFSELAQDYGLTGILAITPGCPSLVNTANRDMGKAQKCAEFYQAVSDLVALHNIQRIFFIDRWTLYTKGEWVTGQTGYLRFADDWDRERNSETIFAQSLDATIAALPGRHITLMKEPPTQRFYVTDAMAVNALMGLPPERLDSRFTSRSEFLARSAFVNQVFDQVRSKFQNVEVLDPMSFLCDGDNCHASRDGLPLYRDDDHLNDLGGRLLKPMLAPTFARMKATANADPSSH